MPNTLTKREIEIYSYLCKGLKIKEIAEKVCLAVPTVAWYKQEILCKYGVNSISQLLAQRIAELEETIKRLTGE